MQQQVQVIVVTRGQVYNVPAGWKLHSVVPYVDETFALALVREIHAR